MKKIIYLLTLLIPLSGVAQQPFGKNSTWHYEFSQFGMSGYIKIQYQTDTVLNGLIWQKFATSGIRELSTGPGPNDIIQVPITGPFFLRTWNDSVFRMNPDSTSQLLYDFSSNIGDSWQFNELDTTWGCRDTPIATVVAIGYDTINGTPAKYWEIVNQKDSLLTLTGDTIYDCSSSSCLHERIYRDFGTTWFTFLFQPNPNYCVQLKTNTQTPWYNLRCFSSPNLTFNRTSISCDYWSLIDIPEENLEKIQIFPNPSSGELFIEGHEDVSRIILYNPAGQLLKIWNGAHSNIHLPNRTGVYFLKIEMNGGNVLIEKVIRQ